MFSLSSKIELESFVNAVGASVAVTTVVDSHQISILVANERFLNMCGSLQSFPETTTLNDLVPKYSLPEFTENIQECVKKQAPIEFEQAFDVQSITQWWRIIITPIIPDSGCISNLLLTCINISEKRLLQDTLNSTNSRLKSIVETAYDGIVSVDENYIIKVFNQAACNMFGYQEKDITGKPLNTVIPTRFRLKHDNYIKNFKQSPLDSRPMHDRADVYGLRQDGSEFPAEITISKIKVNGNIEYTAIIRDISERARLIEELRDRASNDPLTGLNNRRALLTQAQTEISRCKRHHHEFSVLMIDLDNFKVVNDTYGHPVGDSVLKYTANILKQNLRDTDLVSRWGGEEFCVLLPETPMSQAQEKAEKLRESLQASPVETTSLFGPITITASIGITPFHEDDENIDVIISRADCALYRAKECGKNRVECQQ